MAAFRESCGRDFSSRSPAIKSCTDGEVTERFFLRQEKLDRQSFGTSTGIKTSPHLLVCPRSLSKSNVLCRIYTLTPRAIDSSFRVTASCSLTCVPPKPRKPPSLAASETFWATATSHCWNPCASSGFAFFATSATVCRQLSIAKLLTWSGALPCNSAGADCSRAPVSKSATRAFTNSLDAPWVLTSASILPIANISLITPNGPLGLAATTARPAMKGARWICFQSSAEKSAFVAILTSPKWLAPQATGENHDPRRAPRHDQRRLSLWAALIFDHGKFEAAVLSST